MASPSQPRHVDVLIVGAGLSGVGAACHLRKRCPSKTFAILEARDAVGGTWDLFRYPGIRSDSDMFTLGYSFKPWRDAKSIADGDSILSYIREAASEHRVEEHIRFGHRVTRADWSSERALWTVQAQVLGGGEQGGGEQGGGEQGGEQGGGETVTLTCSFLYACTGYYRYDEGYSPSFPDAEQFEGELIHPQHWPQDLDVTGKRVVVIGSGATAVTLVPALSEQAQHVTMLQRSPSYILSLPGHDPLADVLRRRLPMQLAYALVRWKNVLLAMLNFQLCRRAPRAMRSLLTRLVAKQLPAGFDVDTHFNPAYDPWDQRLCLVPDGDLFKALRSGKASVATGTIDAFTQNGIRLASGQTLPADVVVSATGLNLLVLGGMEVAVDGERVDVGKAVAYKGMMLCGVPNLAMTLGYTNASWTLKADLVAEYVCRLLAHMDRTGATRCVPTAPHPSLPTDPIIDLQSGYVTRSIDALPRQGANAPWRLHQNYVKDVRLLRRGPIDDEMQFATGRVEPAGQPMARAITAEQGAAGDRAAGDRASADGDLAGVA